MAKISVLTIVVVVSLSIANAQIHGYGGHPSGYGGHTSGYGGHSSGYGGHSSGYAAQSSGYGSQSSGYGGHHEEDSYPQYKFGYEVSEPHTGDFKSQQETRDGDKVEGYYTLLDADGYIRTVRYTSSKETGFLAHVTREPSGHQPQHGAQYAQHQTPVSGPAYHH